MIAGAEVRQRGHGACEARGSAADAGRVSVRMCDVCVVHLSDDVGVMIPPVQGD